MTGALPLPQNEPGLDYAPGSPERATLKARLSTMSSECVDIPHVIGGTPMKGNGAPFAVCAPHRHDLVLGRFRGGADLVPRAIEAARHAAKAWQRTSFDDRARVFQRAADLLAGPWRATLNAATMLGQSKTVYQAEIDAGCELVDFLRFNVAYASRLIEQPLSVRGVYNTAEARPLEGFVFAVTPFNFTAIAGNLPAAPALLGNVVIWKPAENQSLAAFYLMRLFEAAGLPPGVINVVYGAGGPIGDVCLASPHLAGVHFTGSTAVFQSMWKIVGERIASYRSYPRLVGETGGKNFVLAHASADADALVTALVRGAFEFQGQKCSAASRAYIPRSLWSTVRDRILSEITAIKMGDVTDFTNFMGAVINDRAFTRLSQFHERAKSDPACKVLADPGWSKECGYFAGPTLIEVSDPHHAMFQQELFGPMLAVHVFDDDKFYDVLPMIDGTSPYALTGSIFARERYPIIQAMAGLRHAAGNLYINDKPTGAVVGQQPFGGARMSGTNDKAGTPLNLLRWISPRSIKETFVPPVSVGDPSQRSD